MIEHRAEHGFYIRESRPAMARGTLLYLHGLGESGLCFEGLLEHPRLGSWRQIAVDLPGYGKSPWPTSPRTLEALAEEVADWALDRLPRSRPEDDPLVVAGHSMGGVLGAILLEELARRARPVAGFVNIEGNVSLDDCGFSSRAAAYTLDDFLDIGHGALLDGLWADGDQDTALRIYYPSVRFCDPRAYHLNSTELVELSRKETLAARYGALAPPSIYILGSPRGTGAASRALLDAAEVPWTAIENAGHWPFLDQPEAFLDVLTAFLDGLSLG